MKKRVTAMKYSDCGNRELWAVFIDGRPFAACLTPEEATFLVELAELVDSLIAKNSRSAHS